MNSIGGSQRNAVSQFTAITGCSDRTAIKYLRSHSWSVEVAVDSYFSSTTGTTSPQQPSFNTAGVNKIFDQYRERGDPQDTINVNGMMTYLQALGLDLEEVTVLAVCEALKAPTMGELSRSGFVEGWKALGCDTLDKMRAKIPELRSLLESDEAMYKKVYMFTYAFARAPGQKSLQLETAIEYWKLLLSSRWKSHIGLWIAFLESEYKRSIAKDTWNCLWDFVGLCKDDPELKGYDEEGAWPSILDSFVGYVRKKGEKMDTS